MNNKSEFSIMEKGINILSGNSRNTNNQTSIQNRNIPKDVIIVRSKGDNSGKLLTVVLDPHAKIADASKPTAKPILKLNSFGDIPVAIPPPVITSMMEKINRILIALLSSNTSSKTAKIGIQAAASAAVMAFEIDWATNSITDPVPNPIAPTTVPLNHGNSNNLIGPSQIDASIIKNPNPSTFLKNISENTSQLFNRPSAAGKPKANNKIASIQIKLPRKTAW